MQLLDRNGIKAIANAIINKIKKGVNFTGDVTVDKTFTVKKLSNLEKGVAGTYYRMLNPWIPMEERTKDFMYMNFDGDMWRLCVGANLNESGTFTSVEEVISADFKPEGYIRLDRHTIPEKNGVHNLGSKNWRWKTLYCINELNTSSKKYKSNIQYIKSDKECVQTASSKNKKAKNDSITTNDMYDFVKSLPLASFDYVVDKEAEKEDRALGFIAEDIINSKVGKNFVFDTEEGAVFNPVSYSSILYGAMQELIGRVEELESQLASKEA